jgi:hypothetical protein
MTLTAALIAIAAAWTGGTFCGFGVACVLTAAKVRADEEQPCFLEDA